MKKKWIGILMIAIGAAIILAALSMRYKASKVQRIMIEDFKKNIQMVDKQLGSNESTKIDDKKPSEDKQGTIGIISIPKIELNVALSEGVDVPSLDAVLFLSARNSQVDVVQSVGRVMRKSPGKKYGYIIIPIVVAALVAFAKITAVYIILAAAVLGILYGKFAKGRENK